MNEEKTQENKDIKGKVQTEVDRLIEEVLQEGVNTENLNYLYRLVDIHKDLANEDYWNTKKEEIKMRYRGYNGSDGYGNYGEYGEYGEYSEGSMGEYGRRGRGRERDSQGRFKGGRGSGNYRGEEMMDEMKYHYGAYSESSNEYGRGNYGAKQDTMKSLDYMLKSMVQFVQMLEQDATSQEEIDLIKKYTRKISEM